MRVFLIFSLLFSATLCVSLVHHQPDSKLGSKEKSLMELKGSKDIGPKKLSKVEVFVECSNETYTNPNGGIISSPNYPGYYSDNLDCTFLIDLRSSADKVFLKFLDFYTQIGYDFVTVYNGPSVNDRILLNTSGYTLPSSLTSTTPQMLVRFTSNSAVSGYRGFAASFANGAGCGKTYTESTGNITSLNYPENYLNELYCLYKIDLSSTGATSIKLTFLDFDTESDRDYVAVYEGLTNNAVPIFKASGNEIPGPVVSSIPQMLVTLVTDTSDSMHRGFFVTYEGIY